MTEAAQSTFAELEYAAKKRKTRRERFLERMEGLVPWSELEEAIRPHCPKAGRGRRPYAPSSMLRVHCAQLFHDLSDPAMEDMPYEVESVRRFAGPGLSALPDETTIPLPAPAGEARPRGEAAVGDRREPGVARSGAAGGDGDGREPGGGAVVDEEPFGQAGSRDASDEEGEPVALRDEDARGVGRGDGGVAQLRGDVGERVGRGARAPSSARRRAARLGGRGLPRGGEAGGEPGSGRGVAGGDATGPAAAGGRRRGGAAGAGEGVGPRQGGASVLPREADFSGTARFAAAGCTGTRSGSRCCRASPTC